MRIRKSFLLHLYIDQDAEDELHGNLVSLSDQIIHSFKNTAEMLALLQGHSLPPIELDQYDTTQCAGGNNKS